jgi:hypothetical protein
VVVVAGNEKETVTTQLLLFHKKTLFRLNTGEKAARIE